MNRLETIKARAEAACPAPWFSEFDQDGKTISACNVKPNKWVTSNLMAENGNARLALAEFHRGDDVQNFVFMAEARQDIPWLLERIGTLFDAIKHGDEKHQEWLKNKIEEHFK